MSDSRDAPFDRAGSCKVKPVPRCQIFDRDLARPCVVTATVTLKPNLTTLSPAAPEAPIERRASRIADLQGWPANPQRLGL